MKKTPHFKALVNYYSPEKGGLVAPISTGFRSSFKFPFELQTYIGVHIFSEDELIYPGDSATVMITLIGAEMFYKNLYEGMDFELYDNSQIIGTGVISSILT